ncbi:MAG: sensor histidine kinase [Chitinophagales bacterium]
MLHFEKTYVHWTAERISRHVLYWLGWLLFYAISNSSYHDESFFTWLQVELLVMPVKLPYTYFVAYYLMPKFLVKKQYWSFFLWLILWGLVSGLLIRAIDFYYIAEALFGNKYESAFCSAKIAYKVLDLIYIASLVLIIKLVQRNFTQEATNRDLMEQKLGAELQLLKNQLHPHFFFNTLNNLYGMVLTQDANASELVLKLSSMMRYMLYDCDVPEIPLKKELEQLQNYIEMEQIRYGERLEVSFEVAGEVEGKQIAPLLLIAFIENAFKHGAAKAANKAWIRCNVWLNGNELHFKVENSLPSKEHFEVERQDEVLINPSGIGLTNVRKRLDLLYANRYELQVDEGDSYLVVLKLDL